MLVINGDTDTLVSTQDSVDIAEVPLRQYLNFIPMMTIVPWDTTANGWMNPSTG
jgi:hypothetical protein